MGFDEIAPAKPTDEPSAFGLFQLTSDFPHRPRAHGDDQIPLDAPPCRYSITAAKVGMWTAACPFAAIRARDPRRGRCPLLGAVAHGVDGGDDRQIRVDETAAKIVEQQSSSAELVGLKTQINRRG